MAKREALRELQARLAERLQAARTEERVRSWLAVECAGRGFLFPLAEAGEIFPMAPLMPVPHAQGWFLGVANLRGHLHGVVDLAAFLGLDDPGPRGVAEPGSLVAFNTALDTNCALRVDRLAGLRSERQLSPLAQPDATADRPRFAGPRFQDEDGRCWQELHLAELATDEAFLQIVG